MHRTKRNLTLIIILLLTGVCLSQPKAQVNNTMGLNEIADTFLGKWSGEIVGENGDKITSELFFEWILNKNFLKVTNTISANGKRSLFAETVYGWQPVLSQVVFWSFDSNGTINEGIASLEDTILKHEWRAFEENGQILDLRSSMKLLSEDAAVFTLMEGKGSQREVRYTRVKE